MSGIVPTIPYPHKKLSPKLLGLLCPHLKSSFFQSEVGFRDALKVIFRLAKKITTNPWVQFGMFIGLFGLLVALIGQFGTMAVLEASFFQAVKRIGFGIFSCCLMPVVHGVTQSIENFMTGSEEFADRN